MSVKEEFSNRWGLIFTALGMAIGAGNLWRFPRLAGQYGGSFLILWIVFLLVWSIPILMAEFAIGKAFKKSVIGSFGAFAGKKLTWMGVFMTLCTLGITFYYSVVTAWGLQYLGLALSDLFAPLTGWATFSQKIAQNPDYAALHWQNVSNHNWLTITLNAAVVLGAVFCLSKGVQKGLEVVNRWLIPTLFGLLALIVVVALSMGGGLKGLEYMFYIDIEQFNNPKVWIEALSQSAWSTGAGWGLIMTIASYSREKEDVTLNNFISGFGNYAASLLAAMAILPAVFALSASETEAISYLQSGNQALTFTVIPTLFAHLPLGSVLTVLFFVAFFMAAFTSLLSLIELFIKVLTDYGLNRQRASWVSAACCIVLGFPSAYRLDIFSNQDWVWGIGLVLSGLMLIVAVFVYGIGRFKADFVDADSDLRLPNRYFDICLIINILLGIILIWWWMSQGYSAHPWFDEKGNWNLIDTYSNATIISQWGVILLVAVFFNTYFYRKFVKKK